MNSQTGFNFIPYLTTIVAVCGWFAAYYSGRRQKRYDQFISDIKHQINKINGPIIHEIESIFHEKNKEKKSEKFIVFMNKIESVDSPIFLEPDRETMESFNRLRFSYSDYRGDPDEKKFEFLWGCLADFYETMREKMNERKNILFKNYDWLFRMEKKGEFSRILFSFFKIFIDFWTVITQFSLLLCLLSLCAYVMSKFQKDLPYNLVLQYVPLLLLVTTIIVGIWTLLIMYDFVIFKYKTKKVDDYISYKQDKSLSENRINSLKEKYPFQSDFI
ncbi:MAG: hypothetical protein ACQEXV_07685 [Bacillota bacterium]